MDVKSAAHRSRPSRRPPPAAADGPDVTEAVHDLNNVLLAVRGYADLIAWEASSPDVVRSFAAEITRACERAGALTRHLLTLA
jgi:signal transduction histidine kinase